MNEKELQKIRGKKVSMVFQDPMSALNPVFTVGDQMVKIVRALKRANKKDAETEALEMIKTVKLPDAEKLMKKISS